jgi:hypothetical protein
MIAPRTTANTGVLVRGACRREDGEAVILVV